MNSAYYWQIKNRDIKRVAGKKSMAESVDTPPEAEPIPVLSNEGVCTLCVVYGVMVLILKILRVKSCWYYNHF